MSSIADEFPPRVEGQSEPRTLHECDGEQGGDLSVASSQDDEDHVRPAAATTTADDAPAAATTSDAV